MKLVECSSVEDFNSAHDGEQIFRNYNFQGLAYNFQIWANSQKLGKPWHLVHNFAQNYCMKLVEGSFKVDLNSSHDGEKNLKTIIYNFTGSYNCHFF